MNNPLDNKIDNFYTRIAHCASKQKEQQGIFYKLFHFFDRQDPSEILCDEVRDITKVATQILKEADFSTNNESNKIEAKQKFDRALQELFYAVVPKLRHTPFTENEKMSKELQNYLHPILEQFRKEKIANPELSKDPIHRIKRKWEKGVLATRIGHGVLLNKGATESSLILDVQGKPVGIYKGIEINSSLVTCIKNLFKSFVGQMAYLSKLVHPNAEIAAYFISNQLHFDLVPSTTGAKLNEKEGIFQVFVRKENTLNLSAQIKEAENQIPRYEEAKNHLNLLKNRSSWDEEEKNHFQKLAIFDYLIGNLDRKEDNWLLILENLKIKSIRAIDNINSFPKKHPVKGSIGARNQYKWKTLNIAKEPFTQEMVDFVNRALSKEKLNETINELKQFIPGFLEEDMENLLRKRAECILKLVQTKNTPETLGNCSTDSEIDAVLLEGV